MALVGVGVDSMPIKSEFVGGDSTSIAAQFPFVNGGIIDLTDDDVDETSLGAPLLEHDDAEHLALDSERVTYTTSGLVAALGVVNAACGFLRVWFSQMELLFGSSNVILVLGTCRLRDGIPSVVNPASYTEFVVAALAMLGFKVLLLDLRKTCRRRANANFCSGFSQHELDILTAMTGLEILVAVREYNIQFCSIISFGEPWYRQFAQLRYLLQPVLPQLFTIPHYHIDNHLGHFGKPPQRYSALRVQQSTATKAFKELAYHFATRQIYGLGITPQQIYDSLYHKLSTRCNLLPWDAVIVEGQVAVNVLMHPGIAEFLMAPPTLGPVSKPARTRLTRSDMLAKYEVVKTLALQGLTAKEIEDAMADMECGKPAIAGIRKHMQDMRDAGTLPPIPNGGTYARRTTDHSKVAAKVADRQRQKAKMKEAKEAQVARFGPPTE
ncbi:hypothetical protein LTR56_010654 [Elasticomyces elasticus]|nr:hypothetical protein LTR56_010654 [Elasticomyces elasticus]KAK3655412.1 hypothetical protein LTR22_010297 [Elasticomyces elasticus]KAK4922146.1 hypothetical protein LTR49_010557 [Elasticomyces elasticus]KAK5751532.1 hypothetical protein LTS12_018374 [Elasticomyces elasticus]